MIIRTIDGDKLFTETKQMPAGDITIVASWTSNATVGWVAGGTTPTAVQTCSDIDDVDNVRCDTTCTWVPDGEVYFSTENETTYPLCSGGASRIYCTREIGDLFWTCDTETGSITYTNCETCEVV